MMDTYATEAAKRFIGRVEAEAENEAVPHDGSVWGLWIDLGDQQGMVVGPNTGERPMTGDEAIVWLPVDDGRNGRGAAYGDYDTYQEARAALPEPSPYDWAGQGRDEYEDD
jgi:hypothetical protein